jgi:hypothetical protein
MDNDWVLDIGLGVAAAVVARVAIMQGVHTQLASDPELLEKKKRRAAGAAFVSAFISVAILHTFEKQLGDQGIDASNAALTLFTAG